jgi:hypothetical protein
MRSVFNQSAYLLIRRRIEKLQPEAVRMWGQMNAAQMLAHCSESLKHTLGKTEIRDRSNFLTRTLVRTVVLGAVHKGDLGKNQQAVPELIVTGEHNFAEAQSILLHHLDELYLKAGHMKFGQRPVFGNFTREQWGNFQHAHLDHHLRQFSA